MNGLSPRQRDVLRRLAQLHSPAMPSHIETTWRTLRALKARGLVDWKRVDQTRDSVGIEGAVITALGRRRMPT